MTVLLVTNSWLDSSLLRTDWVQESVERKGCQGMEEEEEEEDGGGGKMERGKGWMQ